MADLGTESRVRTSPTRSQSVLKALSLVSWTLAHHISTVSHLNHFCSSLVYVFSLLFPFGGFGRAYAVLPVEVWHYSFPNSLTLAHDPLLYPLHQPRSVQRHAPLSIFFSPSWHLCIRCFPRVNMILYLPTNVVYDICLVRPNLSCGQGERVTWRA